MDEIQELIDSLAERAPQSPLGEVIVSWYRQQQRELPWRQLFAEKQDPFVIWISEIMLQQTTIQVVIPAYKRFLQIFPDVRSLAAADEEAVRLACRGLGYYRRFRMLHAAARELVARARVREPIPWPRTFAAWRELPGVGDYTAAALVSIAFGVPKAVVDGNVERVLCRIFDLRVVPDPKIKKLFQKIGDRLIPKDAAGDYNQGVMELGQTVCTKQQPRCGECPLRQHCLSAARGSQSLAPQSRKPPTYEDVRLHLLVMRRDNQVALVQRTGEARFLGGTLGFPTAIEEQGGQLKWENEGRWPALGDEALGRFQHSITKHRIEAFVHHQSEIIEPKGLVWVSLDELEAQLVSNLDRKALKLIHKRSPALPLATSYLN